MEQHSPEKIKTFDKVWRWLCAWGPVIGWMGVIFWFSAQSGLPSPKDDWLDFVLKKSAHVLEYAALTALWLRALGSERLSWRSRLTIALGVAWLYALTDEYHQSFVPGRSASLRDVGFDWFGAVIAVWGWRRWRGPEQS